MDSPATYRLHCEMLIRRPPAAVFPFFEDARNLSEITPPWLHFRILTPGRIEMRPGAEIEYRIRMMGLPMYWKTVIKEYAAPFRFVDEQERGPYTYWHHLHTFRESPEGTIASDDVDYALPFGPFGKLAHAVMVKRQLLEIFRYRQQALSRHFAGDTSPIADPVIVPKTL
jgi:ligand-binding SRPBCC domain-containing protein